MAKIPPAMLGVLVEEGKPVKHSRSVNEAVEDAHAAKRRATADWIEGRISPEEHHLIHTKANHVIKHKGKI